MSDSGMTEVRMRCATYPEDPGDVEEEDAVADEDLWVDRVDQSRHGWSDGDDCCDDSAPVLIDRGEVNMSEIVLYTTSENLLNLRSRRYTCSDRVVGTSKAHRRGLCG